MEVYIGNLRKGISARELREIFSHMGEIVEIEIIRSGEPDPFGRDFAILYLANTEPAEPLNPTSQNLLKTENSKL